MTQPTSESRTQPETHTLPYDVICIGAGPTGLACAIEAKRAGLRPLVIDKGCLCNSLYHYPTNMVFFTTPERLEIGDLPLHLRRSQTHSRRSPEILSPRRRALRPRAPPVRNRRRSVDRQRRRIQVLHARCQRASPQYYAARKLVLATGYYDLRQSHGHSRRRSPARLALFHRSSSLSGVRTSSSSAQKIPPPKRPSNSFAPAPASRWSIAAPTLGRTLKYWVKPDIENRIEPAKSAPSSTLMSSASSPAKSSFVSTAAGERALPAAQVFALTGYHPDFAFLRQAGRQARSRNAQAALRSRKRSKATSPVSTRRRNHRRKTHQRNLHRKWPVSRQANHRRPHRRTPQSVALHR